MTIRVILSTAWNIFRTCPNGTFALGGLNQLHLATKDKDGGNTECIANTVSYVTMWLLEGLDMPYISFTVNLAVTVTDGELNLYKSTLN